MDRILICSESSVRVLKWRSFIETKPKPTKRNRWPFPDARVDPAHTALGKHATRLFDLEEVFFYLSRLLTPSSRECLRNCRGPWRPMLLANAAGSRQNVRRRSRNLLGCFSGIGLL